MLFNPVKQMVNREGDTEQLKAQSQMIKPKIAAEPD